MHDLESVMSKHAKDTNHSIHWANVKIIGRENHLLSCKIREAINIYLWRLAMNHDQDYNLPPIYGTILQLHNKAAAINSKHSNWRRSLDELPKLCLNFQSVCWRKGIFICLRTMHLWFLWCVFKLFLVISISSSSFLFILWGP